MRGGISRWRGRRCFNETALLKARKFIPASTAARRIPCFNETALLKARKLVCRFRLHGLPSRFNETALLKARKFTIHLFSESARNASMRPRF